MDGRTESLGEQRVLQVLAADGSVEREVAWTRSGFEIGRKGSEIECPDDSEMAEHPIRLTWKDGRATIEDSGGGSGVWLRVDAQEGRLLRSGDQVWVGAQLLLLRKDEEGWVVRHHGPDGRLRGTHRVPSRGLFIGRASDLVLDEGDSHLSRRHAQLVPEEGALRLYDRSAHNGTYLKLSSPAVLPDGGEFRVARHRFRFVRRRIDVPWGDGRRGEMSGGEGGASNPSEPARAIGAQKSQSPRLEGISATRQGGRDRGGSLSARLRRLASKTNGGAAAPASAGPTRREVGGAAEDGTDRASAVGEKVLLVIDSPEGSVSLEARAGMTVLEAVQQAGLARGEPVDWECSDGGCGVCVLGVVEGADRLDPPDPIVGEMRTIQITEQVVPDPTKYRLACLARVRGTVRLRKLT